MDSRLLRRLSASLSVPLLAMASYSSAQTLPVLSIGGADTSTNGWRPVLSASGGYLTDPLNDSQTGQDVCEIVGTASSPGAYFGSGTIGGVQYMGFRVRLEAIATTGGNYNLSALKQATWFGFNFDGDASVDMWVGSDNISQQTNQHQLVIANVVGQNNNTTNVGPSNASIDYSTGGSAVLPIKSYALQDGTNFSYQLVSGTNTTLGTSTGLGPDGTTDAILSWVVPYADFVSAVNSTAVMGTGFGFNSNSSFSVVVVTSNTQNTVNQDVLGLDGIVSTVSFSYSAPMTTSYPIPEASTATMASVLLLPFVLRRRRRS